MQHVCLPLLCLVPLLLAARAMSEEIAQVPVFHVAEISFTGPRQSPTDAPARDITVEALFRHETTRTQLRIHGFWDGDGHGGNTGDVFKIRFCPTLPGRWRLAAVSSNARHLDQQREGAFITALPSTHPGFWIVDPQSAGRRWYMRSNGAHPYILGNTHYTFLSGHKENDQPSGNDIARDIARNAEYFKKLRFALHGDRYVHPTEKPFLDDAGRPTDKGDFSHRPNPSWFHHRVDLAVREAFRHDLIADLILAGPDTEDSRATLRAAANRNDPAPWLRYIAARYGSYPNVWLCLANEYNIRQPKFTEAQIAGFGQALRSFLPYPTPLSVHASPPILWSSDFDTLGPWHDHHILQLKLKKIGPAADAIREAWGARLPMPRNRPSINDELSYEGAGDRHLEGDTIEAHLGAFLGGGYGSTGFKPANKLGHYFSGNFDPAQHTSADNLRFLRVTIDRHIAFWNMAPDAALFSNLDPAFRALAWPGREYALGSNKAAANLVAHLPPGAWTVTLHDLIAMKSRTLSSAASGDYSFSTPASRAVLIHFRNNDPAPR